MHLAKCVKYWAPLWAWSCFGFEGMNGWKLEKVHPWDRDDMKTGTLYLKTITLTSI